MISAREALAHGNPAPLLVWADAPARRDEERFEAALLLAEHGELELARRIASLVLEPALAEELRALFEVPAVETDSEDEDDDDLSGPARSASELEDVAELFLAWFGGRRDLYASQWYDERRKRGGYRPVERPLTLSVARAHLDGRSTVGQYLLHPDGSASFGALDLDLDAGALATFRATRGQEIAASEHPALRAYALGLLRAAASLGIALFGEDSGGKGAHLWAFFQPRRPARAVRAMFQAVLRAAGPQPPEVGVELFPKQETLGPRGLSSLVKLPLGIHQTTGRRCHLLDSDLRPIESASAALARLRAVDVTAMDAVLGGRVALLPSPELGPREPLPPAERPVLSSAVLAETLRNLPEEEEPACAERILSSCDALRALVHGGLERRTLAPDEARAVAYTLGLLGRTPRTARDLFARAQISSRELDRLKNGLPPPMGCTKLRAIAKMPRCAGCVDKALPYSTPVLHALSLAAVPPPRAPAYVDALDRVLAEDPLEAIGTSLRRIEEKLDALVDPDAGGDTRR